MFLGQWQTYPLPQNPHLLTPQPQIPNLNVPPPQLTKSMPYQYTPPSMNLGANMGPGMPQLQPTAIPQITTMPVLPSGITPNLSLPPVVLQLLELISINVLSLGDIKEGCVMVYVFAG